VVGIDSDVLFPLCEQEFLADNIPGADFVVISSLFGHDGFLLEFEQLSGYILKFLSNRTTLSLENSVKNHVAGKIA
jgi:homoserine O-acetyltransferase